MIIVNFPIFEINREQNTYKLLRPHKTSILNASMSNFVKMSIL